MLLLLVFVLVPIIEIGLFIEVGGWLGLWPTLGIVVLTAVIGTYLLRTQGIGILAELQQKLDSGQDPSATLANGALILVAGVVLLTPGFFTDAVGFALLVPPIRAALIRAAAHRVLMRGMTAHGVHVHTTVHTSTGTTHTRSSVHRPAGGRGETIEGEFTRVDDTPDDTPDEDADRGANRGKDIPDRR